MSTHQDPPPGPTALLVNALRHPGPNDSTDSNLANPSSADGTESLPPSTSTSGSNTPNSELDRVGRAYYVATGMESRSSLSADSRTRLIPARPSLKTKTRRSHNFAPRISHFDRNNPSSQKDPFRGFYTLFWIVVAVGAARTGVRHYEDEGVVFGTSFATYIGKDAVMLAFSDAVMVGSTFLCVPFIQMLNRGWIRYYWLGAIIQHVLQTAFLALAVRWTFHRQWPWVQSGFLTLHSLSMLMKIHSYCAYNGELSEKARQAKLNEAKLDRLVADCGGRAKVEREARASWEKELSMNGNGETIEPRELDGAGLTRRLSSRRRSSAGAGGERPSLAAHDAPQTGLDILTWHSDERISALAMETAVLQEALLSTGDAKVSFPNNVTYWNFCDYLLVPTLVYELEYPRTNMPIRPLYILEKTLATFGTFSVIILIVEHYILPLSPTVNEHTFALAALDLAIPFMVNYLLIFFLIFECVCNVFAEVTGFADREFYQDWWNSTSFDEFSRRWNVPVHAFLLRHVYTSTMTTYHFSKFQAAFITFLLSACVHELVMAVVTKKIRMYLFACQMAQIPFIMFGRLPFIRNNPLLGNLTFWIGLLSGFPTLAVAYLRH